MSRISLAVPSWRQGFVKEPPSISSVANVRGNAVGDSDGGYTVTLTGTNFADGGLTGVTFGGTPGTSLAVTSATTATITVPSGTAGEVNVAVAGPGGTRTLANGYRYWDPAAISTTGWWRETRVLSGSNITQWTDKSGNARHFTAAANWPQVGATLNGKVTASFNGAAQKFVSTATLDNVFGAFPHAHTLFAVVVQTSATSGVLLKDAGGWSFFLTFLTTGPAVLESDPIDYVTVESPDALSNGVAYVYEARTDLANLFLRINGDNGTELSAAFAGLGGSDVLSVGDDGYNGRIAEMMTASSDLSSTVRGYYADYAVTRYGISP